MEKFSGSGIRLWLLLAGVAACTALLLHSSGVGVSRPGEEKMAVVLVGHGIAPKDFPREKVREFRRLHGQIMDAGGDEKSLPELVARAHALEREIRRWKRTPENDPYDASVKELATRIQTLGGFAIVEVAHNELCGLDVDEAVDSVIRKGAGRVIVITTMLIKGSTHSEQDIAGKVEKAKRAHPNVHITYAWPFNTDQLAQLFVEQVNRFARLAEK